MILNSDKEIQVVGLAEDGYEAVDLAAKKKPDVVLMDLKMPGMNGIRATQEILAKDPKIQILILTTFAEDEWVFDAIRSGAAGYLLKGTPRHELIAAVKGTVAGKSYIDPAVGARLLSEIARVPVHTHAQLSVHLSERELDVLRLVAGGLTNAQVSERLHLTKGTVRNYVSAILAKLEVEDRTQAALFAINNGLTEKTTKD
jgi:DNA-binding NarL/FixJ family response regulator